MPEKQLAYGECTVDWHNKMQDKQLAYGECIIRIMLLHNVH